MTVTTFCCFYILNHHTALYIICFAECSAESSQSFSSNIRIKHVFFLFPSKGQDRTFHFPRNSTLLLPFSISASSIFDDWDLIIGSQCRQKPRNGNNKGDFNKPYQNFGAFLIAIARLLTALGLLNQQCCNKIEIGDNSMYIM